MTNTKVSIPVTSLTTQEAWAQLPQAFDKLLTDVKHIGNLVVFLLDNDPDARDKFRSIGVTPGVYQRLEKVGRGTMLPELYESGLFGRLPIDQQRLVVAGGVTAIVEKPNGAFDTIQVDLLRADTATIDLVVARDHIRTPAEQRQIIERNRVQRSAKPVNAVRVPWVVVGKTLVFRKDTVMTRGEILTALRALEA
jgi:hypothetical protein